MKKINSEQERQPSIVSFLWDIPNACSLAGLLCAVLAIYFATLGNFSIAIVAVLWAVLFDWGDGLLARRISGRTSNHKAFGGQLDSLIDIVSFGAFPAVFLLSYGEFSPYYLPGAFCILAAGALRLSYFNVFGLIDTKTYMGLAIDNNAVILSLVFLFHGIFENQTFSIILYVVVVGLAILNIAPIRTPKFPKKFLYVLGLYTISLTFIYIWIQLS